ncbi:hypothetical protein PLESTF_001054400 [Pleodorina starrii]|nr:hypothetical protein PLESTF_001054400 [Pleodorina starrii]
MAIASAKLQPATADGNTVTPALPGNSGKLKRKFAVIAVDSDSRGAEDSDGDSGDSDGADSTDADCEGEGREAGEAPIPHTRAGPVAKRLAPTHPTRKDQSDGSWRKFQAALNPNKCHKRGVAGSKAEEAALELPQRQNAVLEQLHAPGRSKAERARLQQLIYLFHLLTRGRPMLDYTESEKLFDVLGVPHFDRSHWSDTAGWQLAEAMDAVLSDKMKALVQGTRFVAISMDECVGIDKKSRLSLHVYVMDAGWNRAPLFIDLAHLRGTPDADSITQLVLDTLSVKAGLGEEELARKLVACSTDGASLMTGIHRDGVANQISCVAPFSCNTHCMAHRTNLAAAALEKAPVLKAVMGVIKKVQSYVSHSSTKRVIELEGVRELEGAGEEAGTDGHHRITRIELDTRSWVCARQPVQSLLAGYKALLRLCFDEQETGLYKMLCDARLYLAMHALMPALVSLDVFSKLCQSRVLYAGELATALQNLKAQLCEMYTNPETRYTTVEFGEYRELLAVGKVWVIDPDCADEEEEDEEGAQQLGLMCGDRDFQPFTVDPSRRRRPYTPLPLTPPRLAEAVTSVQQEVTAAVTELVSELESRFPPNELLEAMSLVYSEYWERKPAAADFRAKLDVIKKAYCRKRTAASGKQVPPLLDGQLLEEQAPSFIKVMNELAKGQRIQLVRKEAELQRQLSEMESNDPASKLARRKLLGDTPTSRLWRIIRNGPAAMESSVSEFAALAQLVFMMLPGSVEYERRCSAMDYVRDPDPARNCLHEHLGLCVRMFTQDLFDLRTFPFAEALKKWQEAASDRGGRYVMGV